jgi:structural protein KPP10_ORF10
MAHTYAFSDVTATLEGPTGQIDLGYGNMNAEEAITIEAAGDKNTMQIGSDGEGQHSLAADKSGQITCRFLKTSSTNALLMAAYDAQTLTSTLHGQNVILVRQTAAGDVHTGRSCAFKKRPRVVYGKNAELMEWVFDVIKLDSVLGTYS